MTKPYDREIIEQVAENSGFAKEYIENQGEYASHKTWLGRALESANRFDGMSNQDKIWVEQRKIILGFASSPCYPCHIIAPLKQILH